MQPRIYENIGIGEKYNTYKDSKDVVGGQAGPVVSGSLQTYDEKQTADITEQLLRDINRTGSSARDITIIHGEKGKGKTLTDILQRGDFTTDEYKKYDIKPRAKDGIDAGTRKFNSLKGVLEFIKDYLLYDVKDEVEKDKLALAYANHFQQAGIKSITNDMFDMGMAAMANEPYTDKTSKQEPDMFGRDYRLKTPDFVIELTPTQKGVDFVTHLFIKELQHMENTDVPVLSSHPSHCFMRSKTEGSLTLNGENESISVKSSFSAYYDMSIDRAVNKDRKPDENLTVPTTVIASPSVEKLLLKGDPCAFTPKEQKANSVDKNRFLASDEPGFIADKYKKTTLWEKIMKGFNGWGKMKSGFNGWEKAKNWVNRITSKPPLSTANETEDTKSLLDSTAIKSDDAPAANGSRRSSSLIADEALRAHARTHPGTAAVATKKAFNDDDAPANKAANAVITTATAVVAAGSEDGTKKTKNEDERRSRQP